MKSELRSLMTASTAKADAGTKYLTFTLARECYGMDVLQVREIIHWPSITAVPQLPPYVLGVINLRSKIIPVADLRLKFGLTGAPEGEHPCIVVVQVPTGHGATLMGLAVDTVEEVLSISAEDIEPTPDFGVEVDTACLLGMAKVKGRVIILLNLKRVFATADMQDIQAAAATC